jgi:delta 1-pyrroline-5-carboxylate dehydrogenase
MQAKGHRVERLDLPENTAHGSFVAPTIIELDTIADLGREVFGPVLHVIRYRRDRLDALIDAINATGYGLTFGLHTRLDATIAHVSGRVKAGNLYINRNVIGAVVGVQPFGGRGLSGTGPKAGGPLYLGRLVKQNAKAPTQNQSNPALQAFASWLEAHGEQAAAAHALACGIASPLGREEELPGPVGERNLYSLHPRGRILLRTASARVSIARSRRCWPVAVTVWCKGSRSPRICLPQWPRVSRCTLAAIWPVCWWKAMPQPCCGLSRTWPQGPAPSCPCMSLCKEGMAPPMTSTGWWRRCRSRSTPRRQGAMPA